MPDTSHADFDPALVEQAARVLWQNNPGYSDSPDAFVTDARAVLTAVAPTLRADGARQVLAAVEARWGEGQAEMLDAAREAVVRIEGGAA